MQTLRSGKVLAFVPSAMQAVKRTRPGERPLRPHETIARNHSGMGTDFCLPKSTHTVVAPPEA